MKQINQDLHVHTNISRCGDSKATVEACLKAAEKQGIKTIGFANHCWAKEMPGESDWYRGQDIEHVLKIKEQLPKNSCGIKNTVKNKNSAEIFDFAGINILIGCETEYIGNGIAGLNRELAGLFDYVLLPANHFHQKGFVVHEDLGTGGQKAVSELLYRRFLEVIELGFGNGIVHPFVPMGFLEWEAEILRGIKDSQYENCFKSAASAGIAIEINTYTAMCKTGIAANGFSAPYLEIHTIARECGCKFFFGSDAHLPDNIAGYDAMKKFAEFCGINDSMLFKICS